MGLKNSELTSPNERMVIFRNGKYLSTFFGGVEAILYER